MARRAGFRPGRRSGGQIDPSSEVGATLRGDFPPQVKARMLLSLHGGRQRKRLCLNCGRRAQFAEVYVTDRVMSVEGETEKGVWNYWLCDLCRARGLTDELEQKILAMMKGK